VSLDTSRLARMWKSLAPYKIIIFFWQLLQDRVPTRKNLFKRRVIRDQRETICALCGDLVESIDHLFITCDRFSPIWYDL
jgi:hypothetical protein